MKRSGWRRLLAGVLTGCMVLCISPQITFAAGDTKRVEASLNDGVPVCHRIDLSDDYTITKPKRRAKKGSVDVFPEITDLSYWNAFSSRYYYQDLSADEKSFYNDYCASLNEFLITDLDAYEIESYNENDQPVTLYASRMVDIPDSVSDDRVDEITTMIEYENPQYFFHFSYAGHSSDGKRMDYVYPVIIEEFRSGSTRAEAAYQVMDAAAEYLDAAKSGKSVLEKETIIRDKMIEELQYKYDENGDTDWGNIYQTSASTFLFGSTVCAGYSKAFSMLMNALDIPTVCVTSLSHAWNEIRIDGTWYNVDVTWDDKDKNTGLDATSASRSADHYFNISDATMRSRDGYSYYMHTPEPLYTIRPACPKNYTVPKPTVLKLKKVAAGQMKITGRTNGEISGYQITYKVGTKKKTLTLAGKSSLSYKVKSLSKGKMVKVRARCYLVVQGKRMYSSWTAYKKVKV